MKVCILTSGHRPDAARLVNEARSLTRSGWSVSIVSPRAASGHPNRLPYDEVLHINGSRGFFGRLRRVVGLIHLGFSCGPDVYHAHELDSLLVALILACLRRARVVYDCHEYHAEAITENRFRFRFLRSMMARMLKRVEFAMARASDLVIAVNDHLANGFADEGCSSIVLPNYPLLSLGNATSSPEQLLNQYKGNKVVIYIGQISRQRGISSAIRAFGKVSQAHPDARLLIIGKARARAYEQEIRQLVHDLGLEGIVDLIGQVPHHKIADYLSLADVGLFLLQPTSERYNWGEPIKLFEYAATGLPVVISDLPAKRRLVEAMENGLLVDPLDSGEIEKALCSLLDDPLLREEMGRRGSAAFRAMYNWEKIEGRLISAYQQIMGGA